MELQSGKSQNMREFRRLLAEELFQTSMKQVNIARALGVTKGAVSQWLSIYRQNGLDAIRYRKIAKNLHTFRGTKGCVKACAIMKDGDKIKGMR